METIGQGFKKVGDIVEKTVEDKDKKNELSIELSKLETETNLKIQELVNGRMGTTLEKCISFVFPMVGFMFSLYLFSNLIAYWVGLISGKAIPMLEIDERLYSVMLSYIVGFFGNKSVKDVFRNKEK